MLMDEAAPEVTTDELAPRLKVDAVKTTDDPAVTVTEGGRLIVPPAASLTEPLALTDPAEIEPAWKEGPGMTLPSWTWPLRITSCPPLITGGVLTNETLPPEPLPPVVLIAPKLRHVPLDAPAMILTLPPAPVPAPPV